MPLEISSAFDYLTGGVIKSRFFSNPIWIAVIITVVIMIIIPLTSSSHWVCRSVYIFIGSVVILFIYNSAMLKKQVNTEEVTGAAEIVGDLSYINNSAGVEVNPMIHDDSLNNNIFK